MSFLCLRQGSRGRCAGHQWPGERRRPKRSQQSWGSVVQNRKDGWQQWNHEWALQNNREDGKPRLWRRFTRRMADCWSSFGPSLLYFLCYSPTGPHPVYPWADATYLTHLAQLTHTCVGNWVNVGLGYVYMNCSWSQHSWNTVPGIISGTFFIPKVGNLNFIFFNFGTHCVSQWKILPCDGIAAGHFCATSSRKN